MRAVSVLSCLFLLITAFDLRLARLDLGGLSLYLTTARLAIFLFVIATLPWFLKKGLGSARSSYGPVFLASAAFLFSALIATLASDYIGVASEQFLYYVSLFYVFWVLSEFYKGISVDSIVMSLCGVGLLLALLAMAQGFFPSFHEKLDKIFVPMKASGGRGGISAPLQSPAIFGTYMVLSYIAMVLIQENLPKVLLLFSTFIFIVGTSLSQSRLAVFLLMLLLVLLPSRYLLRNRKWFKGIFVALCGLLLMGLAGYFGRSRLKNFNYNVKQGLESGQYGDYFDRLTSRRITYWKAAIEIWRDNPLVGVGPGVYHRVLEAYPHYREFSGEFTHPHNLFLRVLCETGLVGLSFFLLFCLFLAKRIGALLWSRPGYLLICFLFCELFEEFTRDAFPSFVLILVTLYALYANSSQRGAWQQSS